MSTSPILIPDNITQSGIFIVAPASPFQSDINLSKFSSMSSPGVRQPAQEPSAATGLDGHAQEAPPQPDPESQQPPADGAQAAGAESETAPRSEYDSAGQSGDHPKRDLEPQREASSESPGQLEQDLPSDTQAGKNLQVDRQEGDQIWGQPNTDTGAEGRTEVRWSTELVTTQPGPHPQMLPTASPRPYTPPVSNNVILPRLPLLSHTMPAVG